MRTLYVALGLLLGLALSAQAFGQSTYATVNGTVSDPSGAVLPGVSLTATNNATGVVSTVISNEAGAYNLASLLPGAYTVSAELPGFQKATYTNVTLGNAQQIRLKGMQFRLDASDVLNHPEPNAPVLNITGASASNFGLILGKSTLHRQLQAQLRFNF